MIIPSNLEISMIMALNKKKKFFDKTNLYNELVNNFIIVLPINTCHFLFTWERLLINNNFTSRLIINDIDYITTQKLSPPYQDITEPIESVDLNLSLKDAINHMCDFKEIYAKSNLITNFLLKYFPEYENIDELLNTNINLIGKNRVNEFKEQYINKKSSQSLITTNNIVIKNIIFNIFIGSLGIGSLFFVYNKFKNRLIFYK